MGKQPNQDKKLFGFGSTNRRFPQTGRRTKGKIAKDRFAFEQAMQGNDCQKLARDGDFAVQERDFFGNAVGKPMVVDVKSGGSKVTDAEKLRRRQLGRSGHRIVRY